MKLCYKGTWIEPDLQQFNENGRTVWNGRFFVEEFGREHFDPKEHVLPDTFGSEEAAISAIRDFARQVIDGEINQTFGTIL